MSKIASPGGKNRVLSLDGGGFRGLGTLLIIDAIAQECTHRIYLASAPGPALKPYQIFDTIIGSSTGGLVAVLLGRLGLDCTKAIAEYKNLGNALFGTDRDAWIKKAIEFKAPVPYDVTAYDAAIASLIANSSGKGPDLPFLVDAAELVAQAKCQTAVVTQVKTAAIASFAYSDKPDAKQTWLTREIIRQTTSMERSLPNFIKSSVPYIDGAFQGPGPNPTAVAKTLANIWANDDNLGVLVNVGQWFSEIRQKPSRPPLTYSTKDAEGNLAEFFGTYTPSGTDPTTAKTAISAYLKQAEQMKKVKDDLEAEFLSKGQQDKYQHVDPPLGIGRWELVDIFFQAQVEAGINAWKASPAGKAIIQDIASKLVIEIRDTPVPAEPGSRKPNPIVENPKPRGMLEYLKQYHVVFIIDDSTSMIMNDTRTGWNDSRWKEAEGSLGPIADFTLKQGIKSVDMAFLNYPAEFTAIQDQNVVLQHFREGKPPQDFGPNIRRTPTGKCLEKHLKRALDELDAKADTPEYEKILPTDIILLTDGEADDDPASVLQAAEKRRKDNRHHTNWIGVQIVQIGNSAEAAVKLKSLMSLDLGCMVDTVDYDGQPLDPEKLQRIMLGGLQPSVRKLLGQYKEDRFN